MQLLAKLANSNLLPAEIFFFNSVFTSQEVSAFVFTISQQYF